MESMPEPVLQAWRIDKARRAKNAFTGKGAALEGGRWNPAGLLAVYLSENLAMAAMEKLVHLPMPESLPVRFVRFHVTFQPSLVEVLRELPDDWDVKPVPVSTQRIGGRWLQSRRSALLAVPSAIIPAERNYLLNPLHPDFRKIRIGKPEQFAFDPRLLHPGA
jgi:RES domain-containing protein